MKRERGERRESEVAVADDDEAICGFEPVRVVLDGGGRREEGFEDTRGPIHHDWILQVIDFTHYS